MPLEATLQTNKASCRLPHQVASQDGWQCSQRQLELPMLIISCTTFQAALSVQRGCCMLISIIINPMIIASAARPAALLLRSTSLTRA
jgi:hypothetical protein